DRNTRNLTASLAHIRPARGARCFCAHSSSTWNWTRIPRLANHLITGRNSPANTHEDTDHAEFALTSSAILGPRPATTDISIFVEDSRQPFAVIDLCDLGGELAALCQKAIAQRSILDEGCQVIGKARWVGKVAIKRRLAHLLPAPR